MTNEARSESSSLDSQTFAVKKANQTRTNNKRRKQRTQRSRLRRR